MTLSIIIVNYKTKGLLKQCLRGIHDSHIPFSYELIVVDNNSDDGSVEMVKEFFPQVTLIASKVNRGFGAGNNLGFQSATGDFVMVMNADVALFAGAVENLYRYLEAHPQVGMAVPKLINPDGSTQLSAYKFPTFLIPLLRRTPLGKLPPARKILRQYLMSDWDHQSTQPIGWALGACLMMRSDIFRKVGGFDERYFLYVEDTDICRKFWTAGYEVHYVHTAEMIHYHKRESAESPGLAGLFSYPTRIHIRSWLQYFNKYSHQPKPPHSL